MTAPRKQRRASLANHGDWIGYRHSLANVWRRVDAGESRTTIELCSGCQTETDVPVPVHSPRCALRSAA